MSATEEHAGEQETGHTLRRDDPEDESAPKESWFKRLKRGLGSGMGGILGAMIAKLQGLKGRFQSGDDEDEERPRGKPVHLPPPLPRVEAVPASPEAGPRKPSKLRNALIVFALLLLAGGLGAGASYTLFSRMLKDQSLTIEGHEQEVRAFQLQEQEHGKKLAEALRELQAEQKLRADMEARLVDAEQRRLAAEASAKAPSAPIAAAPIAVKPEQAAPADAGAEAKVTVRPSKASSFRPPTTANCSLASSDPATLRRCIDDYNRK